MKVPEYDNQTVHPEGLPGVREGTPARLAQLSEIGPGEQVRFGQQLQQAGSEFARVATQQQNDVAEAAAKDQDTKYTEALAKILHDPTNGYMNQLGKNAVDAREGTVKTIQDMRQALEDQLPDDISKGMFRQQAAQRTNAATLAVDEHASRQTKEYTLQSSKASAGANRDLAVAAYNPMPGADNSTYVQSIQAQHAELNKQADLLGLDGDARKNYLLYGGDGKSGMVSTQADVVTHLVANGQTAGARDYFDRIQGDLPPAAADQLRKLLQTGTDKDASLGLAIQIKGQTQDVGQQEKMLDGLFKDGKINEQTHELTLQKLRADNSQRRGEESEQDKQVLGNVWTFRQKNPGSSIADLSATTLHYIERRGLGAAVSAMFKNDGEGGAHDFNLFNDLSRMAAEDPEKYQGLDLTKFVGELSRTHADHLLGLQTAILKGNTKEVETNKLVQTTLTDTKASLKAAGINVNPKPDSSDARNLDAFVSNLHDQLIAARDEKGAPLTREESRTIALGSLKSQVLAGSGIFGTQLFKTEVAPYKMTPEQKAAKIEIPAPDRTAIMQSLQNAGLPPSEDNIQKMYKRAKGIR